MRIVTLALALSASVSLFADTVVLKTGEVMDGKILKNDDDGIELEVQYGTLLIKQEKVLRVENETPEAAADREKREAEQKEFAAKMHAEGKVLYKGKWVSEKEKKAEEDKVAAAKKKRADDLAAKKKAEEDAAAKKKAEQDRLAAEQAKQQQLVAQQDDRRNGRNTRDNRTRRNTRSNAGDQVDDIYNRLPDAVRNSIDPGMVQQFINNNTRRRY